MVETQFYLFLESFQQFFEIVILKNPVSAVFNLEHKILTKSMRMFYQNF